MSGKVLVFGTFDVLHPGHHFLLSEAKKKGVLFVVVARDANVVRFKGRPPQQSESTRVNAIRKAFPDATVLLGDAKDFLSPVRDVKPDLIVLGYDQKLPPSVRESDFPCSVIRLPAFHPHIYKSSLLRTHTHLPATLLTILLSLAAISGAYWFTVRLLHELSGALNMDSFLYMTVGRGILNGLVPYQDLFENKPPGIFLVSALSLAFGSMTLAHVLQGIVLCVIAVVPGCIGWLEARRRHTSWAVPTLLGACFGIPLALFAAERAGEFQVESFGACAGVLALLCLALDDGKSWWPRIGTGLLTGVALFFKEPFVLTVMAGALLLTQHPKDAMQRFGVPLVGATIAGVLVFALAGWLSAYLQIYLPEMLFSHIQIFGSPWMRAFEMDRTFVALFYFSPWFTASIIVLVASMCWQNMRLYGIQSAAMLVAGGGAYLLLQSMDFGYLPQQFFLFLSIVLPLSLLGCGYLLCMRAGLNAAQRAVSLGLLLSVALLFCVLVISGIEVFRDIRLLLFLPLAALLLTGVFLFSVRESRSGTLLLAGSLLLLAMSFSLPLASAAAVPRFSGIWFHSIPLWHGMFLLVLLVESLRAWARPSVFWAVLSMLAAIYLVGLANGMGGHFFPHHFVFAVPVFFAVFVVFLRQHVTADARIHVATVVLAVLLSVSCFVPRSDMQLASAVAAEMSRRAAQAQEVAAEIDAVLDRCSIPRYLYLGDVSAGPFAYTRHSPLGPPFLQFQYRFQIDANPWFTHAFEENLQRAEFIVLRSLHTGPWSQIVKETIHDDFTDIPWPCAGEVAPQSPYFFLYRRTEEL